MPGTGLGSGSFKTIDSGLFRVAAVNGPSQMLTSPIAPEPGGLVSGENPFDTVPPSDHTGVEAAAVNGGLYLMQPGYTEPAPLPEEDQQEKAAVEEEFPVLPVIGGALLATVGVVWIVILIKKPMLLKEAGIGQRGAGGSGRRRSGLLTQTVLTMAPFL